MSVCAAALVLRQAQHEGYFSLLTLSLSKGEQRRSIAR